MMCMGMWCIPERGGAVMDDFIIRALLGGIGVALVAGPLGAFVVWRRMAYFGDTMAHSALMGIALGLLLGVNIHLAVVAVAVFLALLLVTLQQRRMLANDTLLGILAHATLSVGLVSLAFLESVRVDLLSYLFGDILAIDGQDLWWIWGGGLLVILALAAIWRPLLAVTVHEELARVEGVPVGRVRLVFMLLIALVISLAMKIIGVLLITALLIIPAATARRFAASPEWMAVLAALAGALAVTGGLAASLFLDTPAGPSVVAAAALLFVLSQLLPPGNP